ncbi:5043_t:CDS:2 [Funneliformis geosporum]|uniref:2123_t:CDS:1 n=1 Tax=Funneliformis geosporum TaxID=1117311 RepID=A0A9W4X1P1_9GLOM|nr:2123_t:CDS:2 [Funneliformis geosporum]CAI2188498.1 5043_t:CDS:2 [Funneliformis geosporum]
MATECLYMLNLIRNLQEPIPQYVLGCIPAIATIGVAPWDDFMDKTIWLIRCLGCPFTGLFYTCCVKSDVTSLCAYWLPSKCFISIDNHTKIVCRPFGVHAKFIEHKKIMKKCVAKASVLERLSSLVSLYYIMIGIVSGIYRVAGPTICDEDWPSIPLALSWTIPAIYRRTIRNNLVAFDPEKKLRNKLITIIKVNDDNVMSFLATYISEFYESRDHMRQKRRENCSFLDIDWRSAIQRTKYSSVRRFLVEEACLNVLNSLKDIYISRSRQHYF